MQDGYPDRGKQVEFNDIPRKIKVLVEMKVPNKQSNPKIHISIDLSYVSPFQKKQHLSVNILNFTHD